MHSCNERPFFLRLLKSAALHAAILAAALLPGASAFGDDEGSTAFQIDAAHDGNIVFPGGFAPPLTKKWSTNLHRNVGYPLVANGLVFVVGLADKGDLFALDATTGKLVWHRTISRQHWAFAGCDNGRIFVLDYGGLLQAFAADRTNTLLWSLQLKTHRDEVFMSPPVATGGKIFMDGTGADVRFVYAVDEASGTVSWQSPTDGGGGGGGGMAIADGGVFTSHPYQAYKFDAATGKQLWHDNWNGVGGGAQTEVYFQNRVYSRDLAAADHLVLDSNTGKIVGSFAGIEAPAFWSDPNGKPFEIIQDDGKYLAVDPRTENVVWTFTGDGFLTSTPIVINGVVVALSQEQNMYLLDAETGKQLWTISDGIGYSPTDEHNLGQLSGIGAGDGMLLIPAGTSLVAYAPSGPKNFTPPPRPK